MSLRDGKNVTYSAVYVPLVFFRHSQARLMTGQAFVSLLTAPEWERVWGRFFKTLPGNNLFKWMDLFSCWSALLIVFKRIKANHKLLLAAGKKNGFTCQLINKMISIRKTYLGFLRPAFHPVKLMRLFSISVRAVLIFELLILVNVADTFFFAEVVSQ